MRRVVKCGLRAFVTSCLLLLFAFRSPLAQNNTNQEAELHYKVARVALKNKDLNAAIEELTKAVELAPENALIQYYLAVALKQQRPKDAVEHLRLAMKLGLPAAERATANNLLAELIYAAKSQPMMDLIGNWSDEETSQDNKNNCASEEKTSRRLTVPSQDAHSGTFKVGYTFSKHDSTSSGCTFTATGTNVAVYEVKRNGILSRSGEQVNVQFERGQCTGDCLEADVTGFGGVLDNISRDQFTLRYPEGDSIVFVSETPTPEYLKRKNAEAKAADDALISARNDALKQFSGAWTYESNVSEHEWGGSSRCKGEKQRGQNIDFGSIRYGDKTALGTVDQWFKDTITRDPQGRCKLEHHQDEIEYRQVGQGALTCDSADTCQLSITYNPCIGEFCDDCKIASSEITGSSFTLRCGSSFSEVFQKK